MKKPIKRMSLSDFDMLYTERTKIIEKIFDGKLKDKDRKRLKELKEKMDSEFTELIEHTEKE